MTLQQQPVNFMDERIREAIRSDGWEFWQIWGKKGHGKTTLLLLLLYGFYHDWDKVFQNLKFLLTSMVDVTEKVLESEDITYRVPVLGWDDLGIHGSKYRYKDPIVIEFMEMFDAIREVIGVLITTAPLTNKALKTLRQDLTATIFLPSRGWYRFQQHDAEDNYYGLEPRFHKRHKVEGPFPSIPTEKYYAYKIQRRKFLVELKIKKYRALQAEDIIKHLTPIDKELLKHIYQKHSIVTRQFYAPETLAKFRGSMNKLEALGILETEKGYVTITDLGENIYYQTDPEGKELYEKLSEKAL